MFPSNSRVQIQSHTYDDVIEWLNSNPKVDKFESTRVFHSASSGSSFHPLTMAWGSTTLKILPLVSSQVVRNEPVESSYEALIMNEDSETVWRVPEDCVDTSSWFPELRQAFHEGDYTEREADYKYHVDGGSFVASPASNPVPRYDKDVTFTHMSQIGGLFPREWLLVDSEGNPYYLRERSGSIRLYRGVKRVIENEIFNAYIGREHPGTSLRDEEIIDIVTSVSYFNIVSEPDNVPDEVIDEYWGDCNFKEEPLSNVDVDDLFEN